MCPAKTKAASGPRGASGLFARREARYAIGVDSPASRPSPVGAGPWTSLRVVALLSFVAQLALCQFFSFGEKVPLTIDVNPSNLWRSAWQFPPTGEFVVVNWLGTAALPAPLNPFSLAANLPPWFFFTTYTALMSTCALLTMAAFLRELELSRPAALFGALVYAWQGDILSFVFPGHFGYIATWTFYALAAWGALGAARTGHWAYAVISGVCCGLMVGLQPDRGGMSSLVIATLFLGSAWRAKKAWAGPARHLGLCVAVAFVVALAPLLALFQSYIVGVSMGGKADREQTYGFATQYSLGPEETLTYLVPGFFGWHTNSAAGPYWGRIGQWPDWESKHEGSRNLNLAISTTGTVATALAVFGALLLLCGGRELWPGPSRFDARQLFYGRLLLVIAVVGLVLAWGYHTPLYRLIFTLPLMDKWRDPLKWLQLTSFVAVVLSAFGAQQLVETLRAEPTPERSRLRRGALGCIATLGALLGAAFLASYLFTVDYFPAFQEEGYEPGQIAAIMSLAHFSLGLATVLVAAAGGMLFLLWHPDKLRGWKLENPLLHRLWQAMLVPERLALTLILGLTALSVAQLTWVALQFITAANLADIAGPNPLVETLESQGTATRFSVAVHDPVLNVLLQNQLNSRRVSSLDISAASRIPDALGAFLTALSPDPARLWFLAGVQSRAMPEDEFAAFKSDPRLAAIIAKVDGFTLQMTGSPDLPSHALVHFRDALAKATFVPGAEIIPSATDQLQRMKSPDWNPRQTVLLAAPPPRRQETPPGPSASSSPRVELRAYTTRRIEVAVRAPRAGYLLINDAYDPDWSARVDGRPAPVLRADFIFRAVPVPAGKSTVTLNYAAHYRVAGLAWPAALVNDLSDGAMLAAWLVAGFFLWRRDAR